MRKSLYLFIYIVTAALMTGCAGCDDTEEADGRQLDAGFGQTMGVADSLYNSMQFRDAYNLYL